MANKRITERELVVPALFCIHNAGRISTTELSIQLRDLLKPQGEDLEILSGRTDDKFSQKVRNLRSHDTLNGLTDYEGGYWTITEQGNTLLDANSNLLEYLMRQAFDYDTQQEALSSIKITHTDPLEEMNLFDENFAEIPILEGKAHTSKRKIYERSRKLRDLAINHFSRNGHIVCHICGFDFYEIYGKHGKGFIEIHHLKPIFSYGSENVEKTLDEALTNLVPLCSNCHRMIHRNRSQMLTVEELIKFVEDAKSG